MKWKKNWWQILIVSCLVLIIVYLLLPRQEINIVTQMTKEETEGLKRILNRYERYNLVDFNIVNISFNNHYNRIEEFIQADTEVDIARGDIKMPDWFKKYVANNRTEAQAVDCLVLIYNPQIIDSPPETIEEFVAVARQNTIDEEGNQFGESQFNAEQVEQYGAYIPLSSGWWMSPFFGAQDEEFLTTAFNQQDFMTTAEQIKKLYQQRVISTNNKDDFYQPMMNKFTSGKVGMIINGPWAISQLRDEDVKFEMALLPKGEEGRFSPLGGQQWIMLSDEKEVRQVMDYLSSSEVAKLFYRYNGTLMPNESFLEKLDETEQSIVAEQLSQAVEIDNQTDYKLYKFFSDDFIKYLNGDLTKQELARNWEEELRKNR